MLTKYKLEKGMASLAGDEQKELYPEIWKMEGRTQAPGGSGLNSARATNFMLKN